MLFLVFSLLPVSNENFQSNIRCLLPKTDLITPSCYDVLWFSSNRIYKCFINIRNTQDYTVLQKGNLRQYQQIFTVAGGLFSASFLIF